VDLLFKWGRCVKQVVFLLSLARSQREDIISFLVLVTFEVAFRLAFIDVRLDARTD
jgi:hypothetical protein